MAIDYTEYAPHPKQRLFHKSCANEIFFGGAAGPGKSRALREQALNYCMEIPKLQAYFFRRTTNELEENHVIPSKLEFPGPPICMYKEQKKRWEFSNKAMLHFCHAQYVKDVFLRQGAEIHVLFVDELGTFLEFMYKYLRGRVRCTIPIPDEFRNKIPGIYCAGNPGGPGHQFVKNTFITSAPANEIWRTPRKEGGMLRQFIPALLEDNPTLEDVDPGFKDRLDGLPEPYRTAYREGDWDIFLGQMFEFNSRDHVIKPIPVPGDAPLYMTFDWGFGKPYSTGWWWVDNDGRIYRFSELYGMRPGQEDVGLRETDPEIADRIVQREKDLGIWGRDIKRLADPTCFNKKPDLIGGGQGPSTAEEFAKKGIVIEPGDANRKLKIRQFHQRVRVMRNQDGSAIDAPMMMVYDTCKDFIRTIPALQADLGNVEDVDTTYEDHVYDETSHICMARPMAGQQPGQGQSIFSRITT